MLLVPEEMNFNLVRSSALVLLYGAGAYIWGYTNAAAAEFTREQGNQEIIRHHFMDITLVRIKQ
jgi:hypothetical protein